MLTKRLIRSIINMSDSSLSGFTLLVFLLDVIITWSTWASFGISVSDLRAPGGAGTGSVPVAVVSMPISPRPSQQPTTPTQQEEPSPSPSVPLATPTGPPSVERYDVTKRTAIAVASPPPRGTRELEPSPTSASLSANAVERSPVASRQPPMLRVMHHHGLASAFGSVIRGQRRRENGCYGLMELSADGFAFETEQTSDQREDRLRYTFDQIRFVETRDQGRRIHIETTDKKKWDFIAEVEAIERVERFFRDRSLTR